MIRHRCVCFHIGISTGNNIDWLPPIILLLSFLLFSRQNDVKYLLGRDFPGMRVGPEHHGPIHSHIVGTDDESYPAALCSERIDRLRVSSPFGKQRAHGRLPSWTVRITQHYHCRHARNSLGSKAGKNYDYRIMKWFAERADLIIIMFERTNSAFRTN
jgi:hypothetical protein